MLCWRFVPSIPRPIQAFVVPAVLLAACGDDGSKQDNAGNTHLRVVAPIQFTNCDFDMNIECGDPLDMVSSGPNGCFQYMVWNEGDEWFNFMDLPPGECTATVTIRTEETTCEGSETFQVERNGQVMVELTASCPG